MATAVVRYAHAVSGYSLSSYANGSYLYIDYDFTTNTTARTWSLTATLRYYADPDCNTTGSWGHYDRATFLLNYNGSTAEDSAADNGQGLTSTSGGSNAWVATLTNSSGGTTITGNYNTDGTANAVRLYWSWGVNSAYNWGFGTYGLGSSQYGSYYTDYPMSGSFTLTPPSIGAAIHTITYKNGSTTLTTRTTNSSQQHTVISASAAGASKTGHDFVCWNSAGTEYYPGIPYTFSSDRTLYAQWKKHSYTITYHRNYTTSDTNTQVKYADYNTSPSLIQLPTSTPNWTRPGYKFLGWGTSSNATTYYSPGTTINNIASNKNYYAIWQPYCVRIFDGEDFDNKYVAYIYTTYNGTTGWYPHAPYIYNGSSWEPYGG